MKKRSIYWILGVLFSLFLLVSGFWSVRSVRDTQGLPQSHADKQSPGTDTREGPWPEGAQGWVEAEDAPAPRRAETFVFDPNHADSLTLLRLGLKPWQIRAMMHYRRAGGRWHSPDDFVRLYGLSRADYARLRPCVRISLQDTPPVYDRSERGADAGPEPAFLPYDKADKYAEGTRLDMNACDTAELMKIPGIGSYYARRIVDYRTRLGGFVSPSQLDEIEGLPARISRWFHSPARVQVVRLPLNTADFKALLRHPYLSYNQVKVIVEHRQKYGPFRSMADLQMYKEFTAKDLERLGSYVSFAVDEGK